MAFIYNSMILSPGKFQAIVIYNRNNDHNRQLLHI